MTPDLAAKLAEWEMLLQEALIQAGVNRADGLAGKLTSITDSYERYQERMVAERDDARRQLAEALAEVERLKPYELVGETRLDHVGKKLSDVLDENALLKQRAEAAEAACAVLHRAAKYVLAVECGGKSYIMELADAVRNTKNVGQALLDELARLRVERGAYEAAHRTMTACHGKEWMGSLAQAINDVFGENRRLREALEIYADIYRWCQLPNGHYSHGAGPAIAQAALRPEGNADDA